MNSVLQMMNYVINMMNSVLQMMNFVIKMMNSVIKMMNSTVGGSYLQGQAAGILAQSRRRQRSQWPEGHYPQLLPAIIRNYYPQLSAIITRNYPQVLPAIIGQTYLRGLVDQHTGEGLVATFF